MDINGWVPYATFITLILTIGTYICGKALYFWRRGINKSLSQKDREEKIQLIEEYSADIHALQSSCQTIARNIQEINKHGSEGANKQMESLHQKIDKICRKISRLNGRLIRVEEHLNGGPGTVPRYAEDDETEEIYGK